MIFLFLIPHLLLISGPDPVSGAVALVIYLAAGIAVTRYSKTHTQKPYFRFKYPTISAFCAILFSALFYLRWQNADVFASMESLPLMPAKRICAAAAAGLGVFSLFGMDRIVSILAALLTGENEGSDVQYETAFIGLTSAVMMTLASKCSPFYAFNDWVDPHTMFTLGKSILRGMLPYRDVYEQKGPLLLLWHSAAALISFDTLTGVWILEIISCFFFLLFAYKIMRMRLGPGALPLVPVLALIVYTAVSFDQGDSAEELCLPLVTYALWVGYHRLKKNQLPKMQEWILIGITSGCMLWIKYSMLGFYIGWIIALYLFARRKELCLELLKGIGLVAIGVLLITIPILLWFRFAGGLPDLFKVYFYQNMFLYPKTADLYGHFAILSNLGSGLLNMIVFSTSASIALIFGIFWSRNEENEYIFHLIHWTFVMMFLLIYFSGRFYSYYPLIFGVFVLFGLVAIIDLIERHGKADWLRHFDQNLSIAFSLCACVFGIIFFSGNMRSLAFEKEDYPQYQAAAVIEADGIENPTLMNYGFLDMGVDTIAGIMPNQRFFCSFNLPLPDIQMEQNACLENGCVDYVFTFMLTINSPNYELVEKFNANYKFGPIQPTYNLYRVRNEE